MLGSRMTVVQKLRELVPQVVATAHRGLEQGLLDVTRHVSPYADGGVAEQLCEPVVVHEAPPDDLTSESDKGSSRLLRGEQHHRNRDRGGDGESRRCG